MSKPSELNTCSVLRLDKSGVSDFRDKSGVSDFRGRSVLLNVVVKFNLLSVFQECDRLCVLLTFMIPASKPRQIS